MRFCEVTVILDDKWEERLQKPAERFKKMYFQSLQDIMVLRVEVNELWMH